MTSQPITYTTKSRIVGLNVNSPGRFAFNPMIEVELRSDIGQPISFHGTLGLDGLSNDMHVDDPDTILNGEVEVTVRWLVKKTRVVPWKAEEVPLGAWLRGKSPYGAMVIASVGPEGLSFVNSCKSITTLSFESVASSYEHSTDGGKTWSPAGRLETIYD